MRIATPNTRKKRDKDSNEEAGDDNQDAEDNHAEDYDVSEDQDPPTNEMASLQEQFAKLQKQFARVQQERQSTKSRASNDRAAAGPASTTSSSTEETQFYNDDNLNRLAAVVGNTCRRTARPTVPSHICRLENQHWKVRQDSAGARQDPHQHAFVHGASAVALLRARAGCPRA